MPLFEVDAWGGLGVIEGLFGEGIVVSGWGEQSWVDRERGCRWRCVAAGRVGSCYAEA